MCFCFFSHCSSFFPYRFLIRQVTQVNTVCSLVKNREMYLTSRSSPKAQAGICNSVCQFQCRTVPYFDPYMKITVALRERVCGLVPSYLETTVSRETHSLGSSSSYARGALHITEGVLVSISLTCLCVHVDYSMHGDMRDEHSFRIICCCWGYAAHNFKTPFSIVSRKIILHQTIII